MIYNVLGGTLNPTHSLTPFQQIGLSHWNPYAVHRGGCVYRNMVEWFWWVLICSAELWAKNDYKSCSLPSVDAEDDVAANDDDDEQMNINYVIGDVLQPQNTDDADAVIVHCVGNKLLIITMSSSSSS